MHRTLRAGLLVGLAIVSGCGEDEPVRPPAGDTTPPARVEDLSAVRDGDAVRLAWTAPGDDGDEGRATRYEIRYAAAPLGDSSWAGAIPCVGAPTPGDPGTREAYEMEEMPNGLWHFALRAADEVPNWSALSNTVQVETRDETAPARVVDLSVLTQTTRTVTLAWTAPGDDGTDGRASVYEIRFANAEITEDAWDAAAVVAEVPPPAASGTLESFTVTGLETGQEWYFALRACDERPNCSEISNTVGTRLEDLVPPGAVDDLYACTGGAGEILLSWTAKGNDVDLGTAALYDLRYAADPITEANWELATPLLLPPPREAGSRESFEIPGLAVDAAWYFAIRTADEVPNWSGISNLAAGMATSPPLRRITMNITRGDGSRSPAWSPDGETLVFESRWTAEWYSQIRTIAADCGSPVQRTNHPGDNLDPDWSPDGSSIVFASDRTSLNPQELWILDLASGESRLLVQHADRMLADPEWSPDGAAVAYTGYWIDPLGHVSEIFVVPAQGGPPQRVSPAAVIARSAAWSPDGERIAYSAPGPGGDADIWLVPASGGEAQAVTGGPHSESAPSWSPDGSEIAFVSTRPEGAGIWVMAADGSSARFLTAGPAGGSAHSPAWSPDGGRIAFVSWSSRPGDPPWTDDLWILELR